MTTLLQERWATRELVGDAQHVQIVRLRQGIMNRGYLDTVRIDNGSPIFPPLIWKGVNHSCWKAEWVPVNGWVELPNIASVKWSRSFNLQTGGQQGTSDATVVMDNIAFPEEAGVAGLYHVIDRGHFSPERGYQPPNRPRLWSLEANEWANVLNSGWQIEVWEGYGQGADVELLDTLVDNSYAPTSGALKRTYTGIVLDCEKDSHPDQITLTCQCFSVFLTDQALVGQNKAWEIRSPVTFADRKRTMGETAIKGPYITSSGAVTEDGNWQSAPQTSHTDEQFIEITLPQGHYEEFYVALPPAWTQRWTQNSAAINQDPGEYMQMMVSINVGDGGGTMDTTVPLSAGWVTLAGPGTGTTGGGIPFIRLVDIAGKPGQRWSLGHGFDLPDNSKLRLTFTNLFLSNGSWYAGTEAFDAFKFDVTSGSSVAAKGWILVEDVAEVVRMILIWAGFQEWQVDNFGWSLFQPRLYGGDKYMMDVITDVLAQGNFIFYMGAPTNDDRSIGVPHLVHAGMMDPPVAGQLEVRDTDMTESLKVTWQLDDLPYVFRYRGAITKTGGGTIFGFGIEGTVRRYEATYYPPWIGHWTSLAPTQGIGLESITGIERTATVLRHFMQTMAANTYAELQSNRVCLFACVLAALAYGVNMCTAQCQIPGVPLELDDQIGVVDQAQAVNSRMWITGIESEHVDGGGEQPGYWRMTITGTLIDTQDMIALAQDYAYAWQLAQRDRQQLAGTSTGAAL